MVRHTTVLENGTDSPFEVRSESSSGVHSLLTTLNPGDVYKLVRGSSDTYLQHWVVVGDAPVVSFSSDELIDNEKIIIVRNGAAYKKNVVPRYSSPQPQNMSNGQRSHPTGSATETPSTGKPPSAITRFFTLPRFSFPRRSSESASSLRSVNSEPILDSDETPRVVKKPKHARSAIL